jgi:hypothetical protein
VLGRHDLLHGLAHLLRNLARRGARAIDIHHFRIGEPSEAFYIRRTYHGHALCS